MHRAKRNKIKTTYGILLLMGAIPLTLIHVLALNKNPDAEGEYKSPDTNITESPHNLYDLSDTRYEINERGNKIATSIFTNPNGSILTSKVTYNKNNLLLSKIETIEKDGLLKEKRGETFNPTDGRQRSSFKEEWEYDDKKRETFYKKTFNAKGEKKTHTRETKYNSDGNKESEKNTNYLNGEKIKTVTISWKYNSDGLISREMTVIEDGNGDFVSGSVRVKPLNIGKFITPTSKTPASNIGLEIN